MQATTDTISSQFYRHIVDIPLNRFIDVTTTGLLYPLIISGKPSDAELHAAWDNIVDEYSQELGNGEQDLHVSLFKEIVKLQAAIEEIALCVGMLEKVYCGKLVSRINKILNTNFVFDVNNEEDYNRKLQSCLSRSKGFKIQLDLKLEQFEKIKSKIENPGQLPAKSYYQSILITIRGSEGYFIKADEITVYEFCEMIKRHNKKYEDLKKAAK